MYLHLGQGVVARYRDIVGVFDMDNTTISREGRQFLSEAEKAGRVTYVSMELPKGYVVTSPRRRVTAPRQEQVYITQMAPATLKKRSHSGEL